MDPLTKLKNLYNFNSKLKVDQELQENPDMDEIKKQISRFNKILFAPSKSSKKENKKPKLSALRQKIMEKKKESIAKLKKQILLDFFKCLLNFPDEDIRKQIVEFLMLEQLEFFCEFFKGIIEQFVIKIFTSKLGN